MEDAIGGGAITLRTFESETAMPLNRLRHATLPIAFALAFAALAQNAAAEARLGPSLAAAVAAIEEETGGRLGLSVTDVGSGETFAHRGDERFPIASTFKAFLCARLLDLAERGTVDLDTRVAFEAGDLVTYSPVTEERVGGEGMTLHELCAATTAVSDNSAANFVLRETGGPEALTGFMRSLGDAVTRLDRYETELNDVGPGEVRDTTSPIAAAASLRELLLGDALSQEGREQLTEWLEGNEVGGPLLRATLPAGWRIADRTGSGEYGSRGVIAVIWPAEGAPLAGPVVAAVYLTGTSLTLEERNAAIQSVGRAMMEDLSR